MEMALRAYAGEADRQRMLAVVHASRSENLHILDMPYRLSSWAFDTPENIGLWEDRAGQLAAWAVLQTPMWAIDYAYLPTVETAGIHSQLLSWADRRARALMGTPSGHPMWFINVRHDQTDRIRALEAAGFASQANVAENPWRKVFLKRSAQTPFASYSLPEGFTLRPLAGEDEVDAYVALHRSAFGSANMTRAWRSRVLHRAEYRADLDLVAVTPEGRLAAFCVGWFDAAGIEGSPCGQIEPMGVLEEFRHRGLGRSILAETLRRLYAYGAEEVYVESDEDDAGALDFYQSVGFRIAHPVLVYRKDYPRGL